MKKILSCALALCMAVSAFSLESGLFQATASTVRDDASYFMDAMDWQKLDFKKFYGFTSIDSATSGNLAAAFKLKNGDTLMASWEGNLWSTTDSNTFSAMYGKDKYAFGASYGWGSINTKIPAFGNISQDSKIFSAIFGMNVTDKDAFAVNYTLTSFDGDIYTSSLNVISAYYKRAINDNSNLTIGYTGTFFGDYTTVNEITPTYHYEYKNKKFTYGLNASVPFMFYNVTVYGTDTSVVIISPVVQNGISVALTDLLTLNGGIATTIPSITKSGDETTTGSFSNNFLFGLSLNAGENVRIDAVTEVPLAAGLSIDDVKALAFNFTVALKF